MPPTSDLYQDPTAGITQGLPFATVGGANTKYPATATRDLNAALTAAWAAGVRHAYITAGTYATTTQFVPTGTRWIIEGEGQGTTTVQPAASLTVANWSGLGASNWQKGIIKNLTFDGQNQVAPSAGSSIGVIASGTPYVATATGWIILTVAGATITGLTVNGTTPGPSATVAVRIAQLGLYVNSGDSVVFTFTGGPPTAILQTSNEYINVLTANYRAGTETSNKVDLQDVEFLNNANVGAVLAGTERSYAIWEGCEDSEIQRHNAVGRGCFQAQMYNGSIHFEGGTYFQLAISGTENKVDCHEIGGGCLILTPCGPNAIQQVDICVDYFNGSKTANAAIMLNTLATIVVNISGGLVGGAVSGASTSWISGTSNATIANAVVNFMSPPLFTAGAAWTSNNALISGPPAQVTGYISVAANVNFPNANLVAGLTTCQLFVNRAGTISYAYNGFIFPAAGTQQALIVAATIQKAESGADASVLAWTPPAVAGTYRLRFSLDVTTATAAVVGWTASWHASDGTNRTPTNLSAFQSGIAAPALTFTTSAAVHVSGSIDIDTDNGAHPITIALTLGTGTLTAANVTASIEKIG